MNWKLQIAVEKNICKTPPTIVLGVTHTWEFAPRPRDVARRNLWNRENTKSFPFENTHTHTWLSPGEKHLHVTRMLCCCYPSDNRFGLKRTLLFVALKWGRTKTKSYSTSHFITTLLDSWGDQQNWCCCWATRASPRAGVITSQRAGLLCKGGVLCFSCFFFFSSRAAEQAKP